MKRLLICIGAVVAGLLVWGLIPEDAPATGEWQKVYGKDWCAVWNASPQPNETVRWSGQCDGKATGRGTLSWIIHDDITLTMSTESYIGDMLGGKMHGRGTLLPLDGGRYEGEFVEGDLSGHGIWIFSNGDSCEGEFRENRLFGTGEGLKGGLATMCRHDEDEFISFAE